nr:patatin family protein [Brucella intermedia]
MMLAWGQKRKAANNELALPAEESAEKPEIKRDPRRIALALGGGAARGWAHIGVLRALDEANIDIEMIAGTSIGALVGGCYLAGKLDELEEFARSLTRRRMFNLLDITFRGSGLFGGMKLDGRLREHLDGLRIEELDRPFVAICTELRTGHEIWLSSGPLVEAMRASYALPGVFEPVRWQERVLVDGALVNPVPVSVCRAYEQRLVLAVNLHYDQYGRAAVIKHAQTRQDSLTDAIHGEKEARLGITGVMMEAFNIIQDRISRARMAGDPPDVTLMPIVGQIGLADFHRASEAIDAGYTETLKRLEDIKRLQGIAG